MDVRSLTLEGHILMEFTRVRTLMQTAITPEMTSCATPPTSKPTTKHSIHLLQFPQPESTTTPPSATTQQMTKTWVSTSLTLLLRFTPSHSQVLHSSCSLNATIYQHKIKQTTCSNTFRLWQENKKQHTMLPDWHTQFSIVRDSLLF